MNFLIRLLALLAGAALVAGTLPSCATSAAITNSLSQPLDTTIQRQVARHMGKVKFKGNVTIQIGAGNVNAPKSQAPVATGTSQAQDYTKAGQHGGALATAPGASAGATTRTGVPIWALVGGGLLVLILLLLGLAYRFRARLIKALKISV
ncbi:hypothetical protein QMK33_19215 [Hymenobacter sp. H14-R3]|uniref:hypothetical protein n=1 Tax=Hymenobacter sp. H14-R3 TaxID=3046308 RepID=UPI0024B93844|nr:hypothetical protein [Hymenobacter sp. H14-R3]MDJ0367283.1 hypothetical protein [Hymenobacter sp. H14-R3]